MCTTASRHFAQLPNRIATRLPHLTPADVAILHGLINEALEELVITDEDRALAALPPPPEEQRAIVEPVTTYAAARGQTAQLQARLIRMKQRIVRDPRPDGR